MKRITSIFLLAILAVLWVQPLHIYAQESQNDFRQQFNRHFEYASRVLSLAKAMPADTYDWRPMEGVYSVRKVFTHIARYNYYYPQNSLGVPAPEDIDLETVESITGKENVVAILERSINHVKDMMEQMPDSKLKAETELYGRTVTGEAVLLQLLTHLSEHVGQAIAYARMNNVVPPWSR